MATYYIATTGNDTTGTGTLALPWLTISKAVTSSTTGDTIYVAAGTYTFSNQYFSSSRNIIGPSVLGTNGLPTAIFDGAAAANPYWQISGGTIKNIIIQNIVHSANNSIIILIIGTNVVFDGCVFRTITLYSAGNVLSTVMSPGGWGYTSTLTGCLFYNIITSGQFINGVLGYTGQDWTQLYLYNCTFAATSSVGNRITGRQSGTAAIYTAKNCVFYTAYSNAWHGVFSAPIWSGCKNNATFGYTGVPADVSAIAPVTSDPLFVDAANGNFRLRSTSPCIDAGVVA